MEGRSTVNVIRASTSVQDRRNNRRADGQKRVAAYCRVSTDDSEQLNSFASQVKYYTELINNNPDWKMVEVYSDEAISGTQVSKREGFQKMIADAMDGRIDMIITKSISRFARNTLDTLKYVRMLKEKTIPVYFEDEKINTLSMDGELLLVVLSSVAQQEVENISSNVKKGLAMKMSRGEMVGFGKALGYDYDPETKNIKINPEEAKTVRYIFRRYLEGAGCSVIANELDRKGIRTPKGKDSWASTTVMGILRNEKYVGDLLQGKTFTVDPITHRRLDNLGEADKYLVKNHHEAIVSREQFDQVQEILARRSESHTNARMKKGEYRTMYTNKYSFSSRVRCGFCGGMYTRRVWHKDNYRKVSWDCMEARKHGKSRCPSSKAVQEEALMNAFVDSYRMMTCGHEDVLTEFMRRMKDVLSEYDVSSQVDEAKKSVKDIGQKLNRLLDLQLEGRISINDYQQKRIELQAQMQKQKAILSELDASLHKRKNLDQRLQTMQELLQKEGCIRDFDREVFDSIIDCVIVGGYDEEGNADPDRITFVYRTGAKDRKDSKRYRVDRRYARDIRDK